MRRCSSHCHCVLQTVGPGSREPISTPVRQTIFWFSAELGPVGELAGTIGLLGGVGATGVVVITVWAPAMAGMASAAAMNKTVDS